MRKKWEFACFGTGDGADRVAACVVIDDRIDSKTEYGMTVQKLHSKARPKESWSPLCIIPIGERVSREEALEYAKTICDRLNVAWVEDALKGDEK